MTDLLAKRLDRIVANGYDRLLAGIRRGIEKESLRIDSAGALSTRPHPETLGSPLTHPHITTDYSEALLEFVTPVCDKIKDVNDFLTRIHRHAYRNIGDEKLWVNSMPCILRGENSIPIAEYGNSNVGRMKQVYRRGLQYRYGRIMQTIAGIHYNFSLPDAFWQASFDEYADNETNVQDHVSTSYFAAIRNFHRYCWLLFYLFGASPAVCKSFLMGREHELQEFDEGTFYGPGATSLRMSSLGYRNAMQSEISVSYNNLVEYVDTLTLATTTSHPEYEKIGLKDEQGEYLQLNTNLLQIENEYYAVIRPKRVARSGEKPTRALRERGVEYLEIRCVDLDPFEPTGISDDQVRFLDMFLLFCLFEDSPVITASDTVSVATNKNRTVMSGRDPTTQLIKNGVSVPLRDWGVEVCNRLRPIALLLDTIDSDSAHSRVLDEQLGKLDDPGLTPSARILDELRARAEPFFEFAMRKATEHERTFKASGREDNVDPLFVALAETSLKDQRDIENSDDIDFEEYLRRYFAQ